MEVKGFSFFGGKHCETSALMKLLHFRGSRLSEETLLGLGGGVGFIYWHVRGMPVPFIGCRFGGKEGFLSRICERIGAPYSIKETESSQKGLANLKACLANGEPALVYGDMAYLPYFRAPEGAHFGGHSFVVFALDEKAGTVKVSDRGRNPIVIRADDLSRARASKHPPGPPKNRLMTVGDLTNEADLKASIIDAIRDCFNHMTAPPISNIGLKGIKKWASTITTSWQKSFKGPALYDCLAGTFINIQTGGTGGSAFRPMYATFLEEAGMLLKRPSLADCAALFRTSAKTWDAISEAALPDSEPLLRRARRLLLEKNGHFEDQGPGALKAMDRINVELGRIRTQVGSGSVGNVTGLLQELSDRVLDCYSAEKTAFESLSSALAAPAFAAANSRKTA